MRTQSELLQEIVRKYQAANQPWPATSRDMAQWAISQNLWAPQPSAIVSQCADQLARAMRDEYITDAQGRRVRAKHAASVTEGGEQFMFWADIRTAPHKHMAIAFQQRRTQIVGDCRQLKVDVDSYNQNRTPDQPIQMIFDFTYDLEELALAA